MNLVVLVVVIVVKFDYKSKTRKPGLTVNIKGFAVFSTSAASSKLAD